MNGWTKRVCVVAALAVLTVTGFAGAQTLARRATSPAALLAFPGFFQGQPIVVRGVLSTTTTQAVLTSPAIDRVIPLIFTGPSPNDGPVELRATFWDVGRLQRDDPRLQSLGLLRFVANNGEGEWPRPGEVIVLTVTSATAVTPADGAPSVRLVAMNPELYAGQRVTLSGQFRGRNLLGDMPQAPGLSQWDFVLHAADGSIWVSGLRPRGKNFNLDVGARVDTREWLEATGVVREGRGLVWIEATELALAKPDTSFNVVEAIPPPQIGPAPEVIFSDPDEGETDVSLKKVVRLQFSRDMNPDSFKGNVRWRYAGADAPETAPPPIEVAARYERANRSVEIRLNADALARFRNVVLELGDGVLATDGAKLKPWSITFTFGAQ